MRRPFGILASGIVLASLALFLTLGFGASKAKASADSQSAAISANSASKLSPILQAMSDELERSKAQLEMQGLARPYYIEYRVSEVEQFAVDSSFGAIEQRTRIHLRLVRAVVRIGDYKQDSYFSGGLGSVAAVPMGDDILALRHALWLATDGAYKAAGEAFAQKQAMLKEFTSTQPVDDFAHAEPVRDINPSAQISADENKTEHMLDAATSLYRDDPDIQSLSAHAQFSATNEYFINTEGSITNHGQALYYLGLSASTQATDGMRLDRSPYTLTDNPNEVPGEAKLVSDTREMLVTLKALRQAPVVEEEYRGPVLLSPDASADVVATLIGSNVLGRKLPPGRNGRTLGEFASAYKSRVLPAFVNVVDDPTQSQFDHKDLVGTYKIDDEAVRVAPVTVIDKGQLVNYLTSRQPILDFPASNGHGRAGAGQPPMPHYGVLELQSNDAMSPAALEQKLIQICRDLGKDYGYRVETLGGLNSPRLLYRVWVKDGHEELVRGATLGELDLRGLRNDLVAAGNDETVSNRTGNVPASVISPSMLFDELEIRRDDRAKAKLPEYPAPPPSAGPLKATGAGQ